MTNVIMTAMTQWLLPLVQQPGRPTGPPPGLGVGAFGVLAVMWLVIALVGLAGLVLWIWMIVDCATRQFPPHRENEKVIWILVVVLVGWLGALIYYFVVKRPADQGRY